MTLIQPKAPEAVLERSWGRLTALNAAAQSRFGHLRKLLHGEQIVGPLKRHPCRRASSR
jgi:hypothetical protein